MSTASQHRGPPCSSCAGGRNAPSIPGATGETRGHYDPRAIKQLDGPSRARSKCEPEAEKAALADWALSPDFTTRFFWPWRGARLRHSPPIRPPPEPGEPMRVMPGTRRAHARA